MKKLYLIALISLGYLLVSDAVNRPVEPKELLRQAIMNADSKAVAEYLQQYPNLVNQPLNTLNLTPLTYAASRSNIKSHKAAYEDIVQMLLDNGANVKQTTSEGETALHSAANNGMLNIVNKLIEKGAAIDARTKFDETPLFYATAMNRPDVVDALIKAHANVDAEIKKVENILVNKQNINQHRLYDYRDPARASEIDYVSQGYTPLMIAAQKGYSEVAQFLIEANADINKKIDGGFTAFLLAAENDRDDIVEALITKAGEGIVNSQKTDKGYTALHLTAPKNYTKTAKKLINHHANVNAQTTDNGSTPLHLAAAGGSKEMTQLLLSNGANINAQTTDKGNTPLHLAAAAGYLDLVKFLVEREGSNPNIRNFDGCTAFNLAEKNRKILVVNYLKTVRNIDKSPCTPTQKREVEGLETGNVRDEGVKTND